MMQEQKMKIGNPGTVLGDVLPVQSLAAMLALVGRRTMDAEALRARTKLAPLAFANLLGWLRREYIVDVITSLDGAKLHEQVTLTKEGESLLVSLLERTCELPEIR
jgi:hypothetical protein